MLRRRVPWLTTALVIFLVTALALGPIIGPRLTFATPPIGAGAGAGAGAAGDASHLVAPTTASSERWPDDAVVYHVFVDRFADGDAPDTQVGWELPGPGEPGYADALTDWMGGDLAGVRARLDHIVASGANTIWLSPVTPGPFFHGYHPTDLTDVDPRFGDVAELRALVADAHDRGLKVIYDLVLNHTSDLHPWFVAAQADCAGSEFVAYYRFRDCPGSYAGFAGLDELPQLDLDHPPLRAYVFDEVLPFWLDEIGVDGFRLDHVEGPSRDFWRALRAELDARWPGTPLLGEIWASQPIIDSYADVVDLATAFPLRDRIEVVVAGGGDVRALAMPVAALLDEATGRWRDDTPRPATYLSSHDQPRFAWLADDDLDRLVLGYTALLTLPGMPVIYYGDEVGLGQSDALPDGAPFADRWFREPMPWALAPEGEVSPGQRWDPGVMERIAPLARLRTLEPALHDDARYLGAIDEGPVWAFVREAADGGSAVLVLLNVSTEVVAVDLAAGGPEAVAALEVWAAAGAAGAGAPELGSGEGAASGDSAASGDGTGTITVTDRLRGGTEVVEWPAAPEAGAWVVVVPGLEVAVLEVIG